MLATGRVLVCVLASGMVLVLVAIDSAGLAVAGTVGVCTLLRALSVAVWLVWTVGVCTLLGVLTLAAGVFVGWLLPAGGETRGGGGSAC